MLLPYVLSIYAFKIIWEVLKKQCHKTNSCNFSMNNTFPSSFNAQNYKHLRMSKPMERTPRKKTEHLKKGMQKKKCTSIGRVWREGTETDEWEQTFFPLCSLFCFFASTAGKGFNPFHSLPGDNWSLLTRKPLVSGQLQRSKCPNSDPLYWFYLTDHFIRFGSYCREMHMTSTSVI